MTKSILVGLVALGLVACGAKEEVAVEAAPAAEAAAPAAEVADEATPATEVTAAPAVDAPATQ